MDKRIMREMGELYFSKESHSPYSGTELKYIFLDTQSCARLCEEIQSSNEEIWWAKYEPIKTVKGLKFLGLELVEVLSDNHIVKIA